MDANTEAYATKADLQVLVTKADLVVTKQDLEQKIHNLEVQMAGHRSAIIYWMIGIFFGTFTLAGALLTLLLTGMYHLYGLLT